MAFKSMEQMKSLYISTNVQSMTQTLAKRWWVDPRIAYLHRQGVDADITPLLLKTSEEYAIAKIVARINKEKHVRGLSQVTKRGQQ